MLTVKIFALCTRIQHLSSLLNILDEVQNRLEENGRIEVYIRGCVHIFSTDRCIKETLVN